MKRRSFLGATAGTISAITTIGCGRRESSKTSQTVLSVLDNNGKLAGKTLKELREQKTKLDKIDKLEELLVHKPTTPEPVVPQPSAAPQAQFDEDAMLQRVLAKLDQQSQEQILKANELKAVESAKAKFGSEYQAKLKAIGAELQMSPAAITELARTSPVAFERMFGLTTDSKGIPTPTSSVHVKPEQQPVRVSDILLKGGSARDRTNFVADALKNPDKYLRKE